MSRDLVDRNCLRLRYVACRQPASDVAENLKAGFLLYRPGKSSRIGCFTFECQEINRLITCSNIPQALTAQVWNVVVTGRELEKKLGIVKLPSGTGTAQACAPHQLLELWSVTSDVVAMCFDTTSTNTGTVKGACSLLEFHLNKNLNLSTLPTPHPWADSRSILSTVSTKSLSEYSHVWTFFNSTGLLA